MKKTILLYAGIVSLFITIPALSFSQTKQISKTKMTITISDAKVFTVKDNNRVKVHTLVAPANKFANATHVIELPTQLIVIDGHFFAEYGAALKNLTDSLGKPVTRFYISHGHPDHYLGFGDAFPNVDVYALKETKDEIEQNGEKELKEKQSIMGTVIATKLNYPKNIVAVGTETIDDTIFIFEKVLDAESGVSLVIKLPELGVYIAQDIVYNKIHLFFTGQTNGWIKALNNILDEKGYETVLAGHGIPADKKVVRENIEYLKKAADILKNAKTKEEFKANLLKTFPDHDGSILIDIYLPYLFI